MADFSYSRTVSFAECDPAGVAHFSRTACWVEEAEHAFLADVGFPVRLENPDALYWPRISFAADYMSPLRVGDDVNVVLEGTPGRTSILWTWSVRKGEQSMASGTMKTVCCQKQGAQLAPCELPEVLRGTLQPMAGQE